MSNKSTITFPSVLLSCFLLSACSSEVNVQIVDKPVDNSEMQTIAADVESTRDQDMRTGAADLLWTIPSDWESTEPPRMVMARFTTPDQATLSISNFSGGGTDSANLARWASQLGIPFSPDQIDSFRRPVSNDGLLIDRYYLASASKAFDIAVTRLHGTAWFFKLEGSVNAVETAQAGFNAFLTSILHHHTHTAAPSPKPAPEVKRVKVELPAPDAEPKNAAPKPESQQAQMRALPGMEEQVAGIAGAQWTAPKEWTAGPQKAMRKGTYILKGPSGDAELSITAFPGDVGGLAANINRWRRQVGLGPQDGDTLQAQSIAKVVSGYDSRIVWLQGDTSAILGAIVPREKDTWFFKASGPEATLEANRQAFADFLETVAF